MCKEIPLTQGLFAIVDDDDLFLNENEAATTYRVACTHLLGV